MSYSLFFWDADLSAGGAALSFDKYFVLEQCIHYELLYSVQQSHQACTYDNQGVE